MKKQLFAYIPDYTVFDIETTGLSCSDDKIVELSAVKVKNGQVIDTFSTLINPEIEINDEVQSVHGISNEMVKEKPIFLDIANDFLDFIGDDVLVGHNISRFDIPFVDSELERVGLSLKNDYIDTLKIARSLVKNIYSYSLGNLCNYFGISSDGAHRALNDCLMNQKVFEILHIEELESIKKYGRCPVCGNVLVKRSGGHGEFIGCINYPNCKFTKNL